MPSRSTPVMIPVKAFDLAKGRLADELDADERSRLAEAMATRVVRAAGSLPVWILCDDPAVARWAVRVGAHLLWRPAQGLNHAVDQARSFARANGHREMIVAHADLPRATDLTFLLDHPALDDRDHGSILVTDRHGDGTNVWLLPTRPAIEFAYGPDSARRHVDAAAQVGVTVTVLRHDELSWDIDTPDDLAGLPDDLRPDNENPEGATAP